MYDVEPARWTPHELGLWQRIGAHPFEREEQVLDFTRRLARDRGWSVAYARGAIEEYRRFCFLAVTSSLPATPSEEVDEVWHQHLVYSRDYWDAWCKNVLGVPLHHDPTEGGPNAAIRFRTQYAETLARYEAWFGMPDPVYWPAVHRRFGARPRYRVVDGEQALILPRFIHPRWLTGIVGRLWATLAFGIVLLLQSARPVRAEVKSLPLNPFDWPAGPFLTLYTSLCAATIAVALVLRWVMRTASPNYPVESVEVAANKIDLVQLALLSGGRARAADTVLAGFVDAGAARVAGTRRAVGFMRLPEIEVDSRGATLHEPFAVFRGLVQGPYTYRAFTRAIQPEIAMIEADMARRGFTPCRSRVVGTWLATFIAVVLDVAFGLIKVVVGHGRGKPVGYLLILIFVTVVVSAVIVATPARTQLGRGVVRWFRERYGRAASSPREHELLFAFALSGVAVLTNTHLAEVGRLIRANAGGGDSGSSGGDGGGSGGGCGGCGGGGD
jgi:uncharacterized protein (TIGR04222 family)